MLELIKGSAFGETQGFSRHMRALARQDVEGIWLTRIVLAGESHKTRLEGRALRAELIPLYVQELTTEEPFAEQRFQRFQIDSPEDETDTAVYFSMDSEMQLTADARN